MLIKMIIHNQIPENSQGQEVSMEKSTKDLFMIFIHF